jgi:hypothetical protein
MADYSQNPSALDVERLLKSATYWPTNAAQIIYAQEQAQITVDGAISEFEERTGWKPFLADTVAYTDYFDATDGEGYLDFGGGAVEIVSVTVQGSSYVQGVQWWPYPSNALRKKEPYTGIRFNSSVFGWARNPRPNQIAVTAKWGYSTVMPAAAWLAIMRLAAAQTLGQIENAQGVASISQDGFSKAFDVVGVVTQKDLLQELIKRFDKIVEIYTRVVV